MNIEELMEDVDCAWIHAAVAEPYLTRAYRLRGLAAALRELAKHSTPAGSFELTAWADQIDATLNAQEPR